MPTIEFTTDCGSNRITIVTNKIIGIKELQTTCTKIITEGNIVMTVDGHYDQVIAKLKELE